MVKCEVLATKMSLVVGVGSVVFVDERQFEIAKRYLRPIVEEQKAEEPKEVKKPKAKKK